MSFILDALKKSETDRQQQSTAEFASVPSSAAPAGAPRWLWIVGLLLAINVLVLVGLLLRPVAETATSASAELNAEGSTAENLSLQNARVEQPSFEDKVATAQENRPGRQATTGTALPGNMPGNIQSRNVPGSTVPDNTASEQVTPMLISQNPASVSSEDLYPSIHEMRANGFAGLPELHLDIHVYNSDPDDRFVFINMSKLREGSQLAEGPIVDEITPNGVVLRHQGQSFILPRE